MSCLLVHLLLLSLLLLLFRVYHYRYHLLLSLLLILLLLLVLLLLGRQLVTDFHCLILHNIADVYFNVEINTMNLTYSELLCQG